MEVLVAERLHTPNNREICNVTFTRPTHDWEVEFSLLSFYVGIFLGGVEVVLKTPIRFCPKGGLQGKTFLQCSHFSS